MIDSRFFDNKGPFSLQQLAEIGDCHVAEGSDNTFMVKSFGALEEAQRDELSLLHNAQHYLPLLQATQAGAVIVEEKYAKDVPSGTHILLSNTPYRSFAKIAQAFFSSAAVSKAIHPTAIIAKSARVAPSCHVGPYAVIGEDVEIGEETVIGAQVVIERGVKIGARTTIGSGSMLSCCIIGNDVHMDAGVCIGQPGFGFHMDHVNGHIRVPQLGRVVIEDRVAIGANTTIDRGSLRDTVIGAGTMIDNLVQIAHNVQLGKNCVVVAQVGIAGSTEIGDAVTIAGQAGLTGHLSIGSGAVIAAQSGVMRDVQPREVVGGSPAVPIQQWRRQAVMLQRMIQRKGA